MSRRYTSRTIERVNANDLLPPPMPWWYALPMPGRFGTYLWHQWPHAWAEITVSVCENVWRKQGAKIYDVHRDPELRDDLHGWLVVKGVEVGADYVPDPDHPEPHLKYAKYLYEFLTLKARHHFTDVVGHPDNPKGQAARAAWNTRTSNDKLDDMEAETGYVVDRRALHGNPLENDDPASVLIRLENLSAEADRIEREDRRSTRYIAGAYTSATATCYINLCTDPVKHNGLCSKHYDAERNLWAASKGYVCNIPDCGKSHKSKGLCHSHYDRHRRGALPVELQQYVETTRRPTGAPAKEKPPCQEKGCASPARTRGLCGNHYGQWRVAQAPTCSVPDCTKGSRSRGLCDNHYQQWRRSNGVAT